MSSRAPSFARSAPGDPATPVFRPRCRAAAATSQLTDDGLRFESCGHRARACDGGRAASARAAGSKRMEQEMRNACSTKCIASTAATSDALPARTLRPNGESLVPEWTRTTTWARIPASLAIEGQEAVAAAQEARPAAGNPSGIHARTSSLCSRVARPGEQLRRPGAPCRAEAETKLAALPDACRAASSSRTSPARSRACSTAPTTTAARPRRTTSISTEHLFLAIEARASRRDQSPGSRRCAAGSAVVLAGPRRKPTRRSKFDPRPAPRP